MQKWSENTIFRSADTQLATRWELSAKTKRVQLHAVQQLWDCWELLVELEWKFTLSFIVEFIYLAVM